MSSGAPFGAPEDHDETLTGLRSRLKAMLLVLEPTLPDAPMPPAFSQPPLDICPGAV